MTTTQSPPTLDTIAARVARSKTGIPYIRAATYVLQRYSLVLLWIIMVVLFLAPDRRG